MEPESQKALFLSGEGDAWFERNKEALAAKDGDPVVEAVRALPRPRRLLEIGCSNGWRLNQLQAETGASCSGIDPSIHAIAAGRAAFARLDLQVGTAEALPFPDAQFDLLIYGFCLYLCDRRDLMRIAAEGDRVLAEGGHLIIYDFCTDSAYRNAYSHRLGYYCYKMDYATLFTWNPAYRMVSHRLLSHGGTQNMDDRVGVTVLRKSLQEAYPDNR
jgi:ubiquinone/menaquinone biosynthesis C-methylase UbiE